MSGHGNAEVAKRIQTDAARAARLADSGEPFKACEVLDEMIDTLGSWLDALTVEGCGQDPTLRCEAV